MVTHSSTSRPVQCLCMAERTGCPVLTDLWSYVLVRAGKRTISLGNCWVRHGKKLRREADLDNGSDAKCAESIKRMTREY